jgi:2-polyprenyl-6-methoxyphenol hydroxylase-like FAD-dependent oxidoreductase
MGGRSTVRKAIGAELAGIPIYQRVQSTYFVPPKLKSLLRGEPAWMYLAFNPRRCGTMMAIDGQETWLIHNFLYNDEPDYDSVNRDWAIRNIIGAPPGFEYEIISKEDWIGRRLVADKFQNGRVFIAGDAAHLWIPHAGDGMNAGIADAADLAWMLAAVLKGWAEPALLEAYQPSRAPADYRPGGAFRLQHGKAGVAAAPRDFRRHRTRRRGGRGDARQDRSGDL